MYINAIYPYTFVMIQVQSKFILNTKRFCDEAVD